VEINRNPSPRDLKIFGLVWLPAAILVLSWWLWSLTGSLRSASIFVLAGLATSALGLLVPSLLRRIYVGWMVAAYPIGWVVSHTVLALVFYLVITPIGLVLRIVGRDPLSRRLDRSARTYWIAREATAYKGRYFSQF
jgi:hypothetical protein